ncbi:MAG: hypothetical protein WEF28_09950 [Acidimicrobiia bacterium]
MMSTIPAPAPALPRDDETISVWLVVAVTLLALLAGWGVRTSVENRTRAVEQAGVSAAVPADWIVQEGFGELRLVTWNSELPEERYSVSVLAGVGALSDAAAKRSTERAQLLGTYRLLDEGPVVIGDRDGYRVSFAYVPTGRPGIPVVVQGVDYYFEEAGGVTVVSMESPEERFDQTLPRFLRFLATVEVEQP